MPKITGLPALYLFLITQALSMIGSRMTAVGLGLWLFAETGNTTPLLLTVFFTELPGMLLGIFTLLIYGAITNYLYNGSLELTVPYVVTVTGSEVATGLVLMASSVGAFIGGGMIAARRAVRHRVRWILAGALLTAAMYVGYGLVRSPWLLAATLFCLMIPLPMAGALSTSLLQSRVPPALQGRVFALFGQLAFVGSTLSFLTIGPLVDRVLEPAVGQPGWHLVAPIVGVQAGAGMRLLMIATALLLAVATSVVWSIPAVRKLDAL